MKTIIVGPCTIKSYLFVKRAIEASGFDITELVSGRGSGTDKLATLWAIRNNIPVTYFVSEWKKYGKKKAAFVRNKEMAKYGEALIAIWNGRTKTIKNMIEEADKRGLKIHLCKIES